MASWDMMIPSNIFLPSKKIDYSGSIRMGRIRLNLLVTTLEIILQMTLHKDMGLILLIMSYRFVLGIRFKKVGMKALRTSMSLFIFFHNFPHFLFYQIPNLVEEVCSEPIQALHFSKHHLMHCLLYLLSISGLYHSLILLVSNHPQDEAINFLDILFPINLVLYHEIFELLDRLFFYLPSSLFMSSISLP